MVEGIVKEVEDGLMFDLKMVGLEYSNVEKNIEGLKKVIVKGYL